MSTGLEHERWEELAAGYALNALEPEEAEEFSAHLAGCERCVGVLAEHAEVAAHLGTLVDPDELAAPSWESIRGALPGVRPRESEQPQPAAVVTLASRRTRGRTWLAAAASVVALAGAGTVAWQAQHDPALTRQEALLATCKASPGCRVVQLQSRAMVVVLDGQAHLMAERLPTLTPSQRYVLWQMPRTGRPTVVGVLGETANGSIGEGHALALPYDDTAAFGLSVEQALSVPDGPTHVVAVGTA